MNKKKLHLQSLALAVMLATSSLAMATTPVPPQGPGAVTLTNSTGDTWTASIGNTPVLGAFTDVFTFSPPATSGSSAFGALINASFAGYGEITFGTVDLNGLQLFTSVDTTYFPTTLNVATLLATPVSGTLVLTVTGVNSGGGSYGGNLTVIMAPVPEPATYGMMIGGLGILAMLARRRKQ